MGNETPSLLWSSASSLGLLGYCAVEWDEYVDSLMGLGFMLSDDLDFLVWSGDIQSSSVKANMVYESILAHMYHKQPKWWFEVI